MTIQEKKDAGFDAREIPELTLGSNHGQSIVTRKMRNYGNKYMIDRKNLNIRKEHITQLDTIKKKIGCRSYDNVIKHLCDLEAKVDPKFEITYKCKTCNEEIKDIPKHINVNKFVHRDLCIDTSCKGFIVTSKEIALDSNGFVISNKTVANGATTTNDKNRAQIDTIEREMTQEEKHAILVENTRIFDINKENNSENEKI